VTGAKAKGQGGAKQGAGKGVDALERLGRAAGAVDRVVLVDDRGVLVRGVGDPGKVGQEADGGRDAVNLGQGVGLGADGTDNTGQGDNVGQGEDRLLETEEEGRPGNVGGERDPVEVEALDGGW
jgi:hypothetical protein